MSENKSESVSAPGVAMGQYVDGFRVDSRLFENDVWSEWQTEEVGTITKMKTYVEAMISVDSHLDLLDIIEYRVVDETNESIVGTYRKGVLYLYG